VATAGGDRVGVILGLPPAWPPASLLAPAFTASGVARDSVVFHRAVAEAPFGSTVVVSLSGDAAAGDWRESMCIAATAGIRGVVASGAVRDVVRIAALQVPLFHSGVAPRPATKSHRGELGDPVEIGGVTVPVGDLIVAYTDGIAVVPRSRRPARRGHPARAPRGRDRTATRARSDDARPARIGVGVWAVP
jgi:regulator of RNase E activity RraA